MKLRLPLTFNLQIQLTSTILKRNLNLNHHQSDYLTSPSSPTRTQSQPKLKYEKTHRSNHHPYQPRFIKPNLSCPSLIPYHPLIITSSRLQINYNRSSTSIFKGSVYSILELIGLKSARPSIHDSSEHLQNNTLPLI